jgi:hypothetical protein
MSDSRTRDDARVPEPDSSTRNEGGGLLVVVMLLTLGALLAVGWQILAGGVR